MIPCSSYSKHPEGDAVALTVVSIALSLEGGKCFSTILRKWVLKIFFFGVEGRVGKVGHFLEGVSGFLEVTIMNFTSRLIFELLFTCRLKDVLSLVIFHL